MSGDEMREALTEALRGQHARTNSMGHLTRTTAEWLADDLLPVVQRIVAEELRAIADDPAASTVTHTANFGLPARVIPVATLYRRADALDPGPVG